MIHQFPIGRNLQADAPLGMAKLLMFAAFVSCVSATLTQTAVADLNGPGTAAPSVENISNLRAVVRGKALRIKLEASTESPSRIEFIIGKDSLKYGTLSDPTIPDQDRKHIQTVDYTPFLEGPDATDTFTYRVRQPGREGTTLTSSTATVTVQVLAAYPDLVATEVIDFGEIFVGATAQRLLTVSNQGGAPFKQVLKLPDGFTVTTGLGENNLLEIAPQSTRRIGLVFHPRSVGRVQQKLAYTGHKGQAEQTLLYATGIAPFHCAPSKLKLDWLPDDVSRSAKLEVTSSIDKPIVVAVSAPHHLGLPSSISLGAGEVREFDIHIPAETFKEAILGDVRMSFENFALKIPVLADGVPAYLHPITDPTKNRTLDFPEGSQSAPVVLAFVNGGTSDGTLYTDVHHEFVVEGVEEGKVIAPGESLEVTIKPAHNIRATGLFVLKCGTQRLEYTLTSERAKIDTSPDKNTKVEVEKSTSLLATSEGAIGTRIDPASRYEARRRRMSGTELAVDTFAVHVEGNYSFDHDLPKVKFTQFEDGGRHFLEFSWEPLSPGKYDYKLHVENIHINDSSGQVVHLWAAKAASIKLVDGRYVARIDDLNPGVAYKIRIVGITPDGRASLSEPFRFVTAVPRPLRYLIGTWAVTLLCLTSVSILIYRKVQARRFYRRYY